nr:MAG TPA: hypothetical protein [Caudoviricetes sp.]
MPQPPEAFRSRTTRGGQNLQGHPSKPRAGLPLSHPLSLSPEGQLKLYPQGVVLSR